MKIISHRGAAGLAPENSLVGIKIATEHQPAYIEIDVQVTKDGKLVVLHDESFRTKNGKQRKIKETTLADIRTHSNLSHSIPTLQQAQTAAGKIPLLIDCKGNNWAEPLAKILNQAKAPRPIVASNDSVQLFNFKQLNPKADCFLSELTKPFEAVQTAKVLGFDGVCLLYSIYNPLVYFIAKRYKLRMTMYTVNRLVYGWFLHFFYPQVLITTDFPQKFVPKSQRGHK